MDDTSETVDIALDQATAYLLLKLALQLGATPEELAQSAFETGLQKELETFYGNN
jgi:hypothetical protein